jgi:hypothetical protein
MKRRQFLKLLAAVMATPLVATSDKFIKSGVVAASSVREYTGFTHLKNKVTISDMGVHEISEFDGDIFIRKYTVLRHKLSMECSDGEIIEDYCDIDKLLLDAVWDKPRFINNELNMCVDAMIEEASHD